MSGKAERHQPTRTCDNCGFRSKQSYTNRNPYAFSCPRCGRLEAQSEDAEEESYGRPIVTCPGDPDMQKVQP